MYGTAPHPCRLAAPGCCWFLRVPCPPTTAPPPPPSAAADADGVPHVLHLNQSITFKGAVRLAAPGGGAGGGRSGKELAVNASLFTCLVMDMPLEKLKLR